MRRARGGSARAVPGGRTRAPRVAAVVVTPKLSAIEAALWCFVPLSTITEFVEWGTLRPVPDDGTPGALRFEASDVARAAIKLAVIRDGLRGANQHLEHHAVLGLFRQSVVSA